MECIVGTTTEVSRVVAAVSLEYFTQSSPPALSTRLARLHQNVWDLVMTGSAADEAYAELVRSTDRLFNGREIVAAADQHIVWALTPVIAASLACGPGEDMVSLRDVAGALWRLLQVALGGDGRLAAEPARRAA